MYKVFVDGSAGTTGLRIYGRLSERTDIELLTLPDNLRKDASAREEKLNSADVVFLCLPDDAAREAVSMLKNPSVKVRDTSTAHRIEPGWEYGFPELSGRFEKIASSKRIANPGCHASGFVALIEPLVGAGILNSRARLSCFSLTGYTGGGKKMIEEYEGGHPALYDAPRQYGLSQSHKHLPEMQKICKLKYAPAFCPTVAPFPCGMEVTVPVFAEDICGTAEDIKEIYRSVYNNNGAVRYVSDDENGFLSANAYSGSDGMGVSVYGNKDRILLVSRFDNLGKGASGAAIQNMNVMIGEEQTKGLVLQEKI